MRPKLAALTPMDGLPKQEEVPVRTAVYDITARTVYLPNGERLEAHSGLGRLMDDPRFVHQKNRGATPPNTYELTLRESIFHGVQAIRLNPVDEKLMFRRDGILAHSYLLGPSGQSNGCVSFKDYPRFLRAYKRGEIGRIVASLRARGEWNDTVIVITADHGEQLGDHGLREKVGFFEQSYHIIGMVRSPQHPAGHGRVVRAFTENVDVFPTLCELLNTTTPAQCDGRSLVPWLKGETPAEWREMATWEYDWRQLYITDSADGSALNWPNDVAVGPDGALASRCTRSAFG